MARRRFKDAHGVDWEVYAGTSAPTLSGPLQPASSGLLRPVRAWLAFDSQLERRRLSPVPGWWHDASDEELQKLLAVATVIFRRPADPSGSS